MRVATRPARSLAIALTLSLAPIAPAVGQTTAAGPTAQISIYNFAKVNDHYYRGGQPLDGQYADLAALGVKTVINLIGGDEVRDEEQAMVETHGMTYVHIPMTTRREPTDAQIAAFMSAVDADGAVYVHCVGGRHRTGVMTAIYRMTKDGYTGEQAFKEMKEYKYGPDFLHPEFKRFVHNYQPKPAAAVTTGSSQP